MQSSYPSPTPAETAPARDTPAQHHRDVLDSLIDLGHDLARQLHGQAAAVAKAAPPDATPIALAEAALEATVAASTAFDRIARCVRRTVLLAQHLGHPRTQAHTQARAQILRQVENAIDRADFHTPGRIDKAAAAAELRERLDAPELVETLDADIATRPLADIVTELCEDLGLATPLRHLCPPRRRTPRDIVALHAAAPRTPHSVNSS